MAEYIDRDELLKELCTVSAPTPSESWIVEKCIEKVNEQPTADVVPKSEEGAECPTCHGTGRIGTTDWLTKNMTEEQIAEEKAKAIAEHEQHIKTEYAREIFEEIEAIIDNNSYKSYLPNSSLWCKEYKSNQIIVEIAELKKKYIGGKNDKRDTV